MTELAQRKEIVWKKRLCFKCFFVFFFCLFKIINYRHKYNCKHGQIKNIEQDRTHWDAKKRVPYPVGIINDNINSDRW